MISIDLSKRVYLEKIYPEWNEDHFYMGRIGCNYGVYLYNNTSIKTEWVFVVDESNGQIVVDCPFSKRNREGQVCYHPDYTMTDSRYRGKNLALRLYIFLIRRGLIIQAGDQQSIGSQKLWYKLSQKKNIKIWTVRNGIWDECFPCHAQERIDADLWDPYESDCVTFAVKN